MKKLCFSILFIFILSACGEMKGKKRDVGTASLFSVSNSKVVAIISKSQILPNFQRCLNKMPNSAVSAETKTELRSALTTLASEGESSEISSPMLMTITKIISEICNDLVNYEDGQTNRKYFTNFDLTQVDGGASSNSQAQITETTRTLASSCWGRDAKNEEIKLVNDAIGKTTLNGKLNRSTALFICTGVLSSSAAIKF